MSKADDRKPSLAEVLSRLSPLEEDFPNIEDPPVEPEEILRPGGELERLMPEAAEALTEEREFFEERFEEYSEKYPGRHLLIVGRQLMGHYATREEAVAAGYEIDGIDAMLVQESGTRPPVMFLPTVLSS